MCKGPEAKGTMGLRSRSPVLLELLLLEREVGGKLARNCVLGQIEQ